MTYRTGVLVMDTRQGKLGEVMEERLSRVWLRPPHGGREWDCLPDDLRLATKAERAASGVGS
ncbi:hypothetical protein [Streptomyces olivoreticuli]|uniref:hypothetical protein n=1 Tax=Streptomyces olivoreticuli TaxID=68246 RepID=UPI000E239B92|nr:hypothetical protein [Streptomyces olivoreticuli]